MKNTALTHIHESLGAKMVPFAGYLMPVQYEGINAEHETVRKGVGVFDVSHMGEFLIEGEHALELIQRISSNDAAKLEVEDAQYSCMPNDKGGVVDDLIIYRVKEQTYLLVVNASNIEKDWNWISSHNTNKAAMKNISDNYSLLAIQGPKAVDAMQKLSSVDLSEIPFYKFRVADFAGIDHVIISATGYTGSGGFEIYCKNNEVEQVWKKVFEAGEAYGIKPIGLAARDTLRLEMGYCLYGNDINDDTSPIEAGLGWITKFTKEFVNSKVLLEQKENGVKQRLRAFEIDAKGIPRQGYDIVNENDEKIGVVTSGTGYTKFGSKIFIKVRNKALAATVVKLPFYKS